MPAELIDARNFSADAHGLAENAHFGEALDEFAAERVLGLEAGDEDRVARILDVVAEVVEDAALLGHTGGGDDDKGAVEVVESFGLGSFPDVLEAAESERVLTVGEVGAGLLVEALGMFAESFG